MVSNLKKKHIKRIKKAGFYVYLRPTSEKKFLIKEIILMADFRGTMLWDFVCLSA